MAEVATRSYDADAGSAGPGEASSAVAGDIELGVLARFIGFNLRLAQDASFRAFARHSGRKDIKPGRFAAMVVIHNNPGLSQSALGRAIARDKSTVSPLIKDLLKHGLIERRPSPKDRRSFTLVLSRAGEAELSDLLGHARQHDSRLDDIVGDDKARFIEMLKKIADTLG